MIQIHIFESHILSVIVLVTYGIFVWLFTRFYKELDERKERIAMAIIIEVTLILAALHLLHINGIMQFEVIKNE